MPFKRIFLFIIFVLFASTALAAKPEKTLVCHVGNELGSSGEAYQDIPDCAIPPEWGGDPADYICPDAGKVDLIMVSENARHIGNPSHSFLDDTGYLWEDYSPEEGIGDDPADFEEGDVPGIDRGCELATVSECPCNASNAEGAALPLWTADFPANAGGIFADGVYVQTGSSTDGGGVFQTLAVDSSGFILPFPYCYVFTLYPAPIALEVEVTPYEAAACEAELVLLLPDVTPTP